MQGRIQHGSQYHLAVRPDAFVADVALEHHGTRGIANDQAGLAPISGLRLHPGEQRAPVADADGTIAKHPAQTPANAHTTLVGRVFLALHSAHLDAQWGCVLTFQAHFGQSLLGQFFQFCLIHRIRQLRRQALKLVAGACRDHLRCKAVDLAVDEPHAGAARDQKDQQQG